MICIFLYIFICQLPIPSPFLRFSETILCFIICVWSAAAYSIYHSWNMPGYYHFPLFRPIHRKSLSCQFCPPTTPEKNIIPLFQVLSTNKPRSQISKTKPVTDQGYVKFHGWWEDQQEANVKMNDEVTYVSASIRSWHHPTFYLKWYIQSYIDVAFWILRLYYFRQDMEQLVVTSSQVNTHRTTGHLGDHIAGVVTILY